ncbi:MULTISPECIES: hypothetical protein [unclassified Bradyrhizobium]|uniref:hypothetical protein n=1 Tax=Bradyrhizobium sp. USDA 4541 TaxID=2817704 RepID=UPI0020A28905|nr:hypothetical protein [Bradyrhizobium sp. USDA 4541]MCP1854522.1 hypothetical protein [Bradyrhizobium sp. USDA 4541]
MFKVDLHATVNSIGVVISVALAAATYLKQAEQAKQNIIFTASIENPDFKSRIVQNNRGGVLITVKYKLLISNLSSANTAIIDATAYNFINYGEYTNYTVASDPLETPINLNAGEAKILKLDVRVPLGAKCSEELRTFGSETSFLTIMKALGKKPDCLVNMFEPYSQLGFDSTFDPKTNSLEQTYHFLPPIIFQLKTATGTRHSTDTSAFSVNFGGSDAKVMPR